MAEAEAAAETPRDINKFSIIPQGGLKHQGCIRSLAAFSDSQVWISNFMSNELSLLNLKTTDKYTIKVSCRIQDICVSLSTRKVWFCSQGDKNVKTVSKKSGSEKIICSTETPPLCIFVTFNDYILVGIKGDLIRFTLIGNIDCKFSDTNLKVKVASPWQIAECPKTFHLAVIDKNLRGDGGRGNPFVLVVDQDFELQFKIEKDIIFAEGNIPKAVFQPEAVCFNQKGDLFISDLYNRSVVIVSGTGQLIMTLGLEQFVTGLTFLPNDTLCTVFERDQIKLFKISY